MPIWVFEKFDVGCFCEVLFGYLNFMMLVVLLLDILLCLKTDAQYFFYWLFVYFDARFSLEMGI
jgi:hypothetical protein